MADDDLDQPVDDESASDTPAQSQTPDLEALIRSVLGDTLKGELDSRFSGLQSMQDKRLAKLAQELRSSGMSQEEQEDAMEQEQAQETAKALQIAELIKRRKKTPEAVDFMLESMDKSDLDEQLDYIQSVLGSKAAASVAKAVADAVPSSDGETGDQHDAPVPDSDKNNPRSSRSSDPTEGEGMNMELADTILDKVGRGQFGRFLSRGK